MDAVARVPEPPPYRPIAFGPVDIACNAVSGGGFHLRSRTPLAPHDQSLSRMFRAAVEIGPDRAFLAERSGDGWRTLSYAACRPLVDGIAAALIERGLSAERPAMVLSGNSIDHALLMLAAYTAGIPIAPISVAYSLQSRDHAKLKHVAALLQPGLIYVADARTGQPLANHPVRVIETWSHYDQPKQKNRYRVVSTMINTWQGSFRSSALISWPQSVRRSAVKTPQPSIGSVCP